MVDIVTTAEARIHLRADTADDPWLAIFIPAITDAVVRWLKEEWRLYVPELDADGNPVVDSNGDDIPAEDSNGEYTVKPVIKAAVLVEIASQFRFREGEGENVVPADAGHGYILSKGATALLQACRKPTVG